MITQYKTAKTHKHELVAMAMTLRHSISAMSLSDSKTLKTHT